MPDGVAAQLRDTRGFDRFGFFGGRFWEDKGESEKRDCKPAKVNIFGFYRLRRFNHDPRTLTVELSNCLPPPRMKKNNHKIKWNACHCKHHLTDNVEKLKLNTKIHKYWFQLWNQHYVSSVNDIDQSWNGNKLITTYFSKMQ